MAGKDGVLRKGSKIMKDTYEAVGFYVLKNGKEWGLFNDKDEAKKCSKTMNEANK